MQGPAVPLESVLATGELGRRTPRRTDPRAEARALEALAREIAGSPRRVLQKLADMAMTLCETRCAGVNLLEEEGGRRIFRWHAVSGELAPPLWGTMPCELSPCGTILERKAAQLMILPERHFTALRQLGPTIFEALLVPFGMDDAIVGAVCVHSHDERRHFDGADCRAVSSLAKFASSAYQRLSSLGPEDVLQLARLKRAGSTQAALEAAKPARRRILVVDDNVDAAESLAVILRGSGHEVHVAHDGREGLRIARTVRPELVLLDIAMPQMNGYDVARRIRQSLGSSVRIVAVTAFGRDEDRVLSAEAGFDQHLIKPIDPAFLKSLTG